jgi:hypothetical protein
MSACAKLRKGWVLPSSLPEHGCSAGADRTPSCVVRKKRYLRCRPKLQPVTNGIVDIMWR